MSLALEGGFFTTNAIREASNFYLEGEYEHSAIRLGEEVGRGMFWRCFCRSAHYFGLDCIFLWGIRKAFGSKKCLYREELSGQSAIKWVSWTFPDDIASSTHHVMPPTSSTFLPSLPSQLSLHFMKSQKKKSFPLTYLPFSWMSWCQYAFYKHLDKIPAKNSSLCMSNSNASHLGNNTFSPQSTISRESAMRA